MKKRVSDRIKQEKRLAYNKTVDYLRSLLHPPIAKYLGDPCWGEPFKCKRCRQWKPSWWFDYRCLEWCENCLLDSPNKGLAKILNHTFVNPQAFLPTPAKEKCDRCLDKFFIEQLMMKGVDCCCPNCQQDDRLSTSTIKSRLKNQGYSDAVLISNPEFVNLYRVNRLIKKEIKNQRNGKHSNHRPVRD